VQSGATQRDGEVVDVLADVVGAEQHVEEELVRRR
jgi:hypothetical protein